MIDLNWNPTRRELRQFGCLLLPAFLVVAGGVLRSWTGSWAIAAYLWAAALLSAVAGWFAPRAVRPVFLGLTLAAFPVGWVVSHVLLAAAYYLVLTPVGVVLRLAGRDPLQRKLDREAETYWTPRDSGGDRSRYFRQF